MPEHPPEIQANISPKRLRIGVILFVLWWPPLWLLAPYIASWFDPANSLRLSGAITVAIMAIQTVFTLLAVCAASKPSTSLPGTTVMWAGWG